MSQNVVYSLQIHAEHNDTMKTSDTVFRIIYLLLYLKGWCVRGSWRPNRTATYWPPLLWPSALCLSRSPGLLNQRPGGPLSAGCWLPLPHLFTNRSGLQTDLQTHWLPVFTELYNSSIAPSISLEWHVWPGRMSIYNKKTVSTTFFIHHCAWKFFFTRDSVCF